MSVSAIAPNSLSELNAVYTERNYATAVSFAAQAPSRSPLLKDVRAEDEANRESLRRLKQISETASTASYRRSNERDSEKRKKRSGKFASFSDVLDDEQAPSFDSYA